jgi:hypothetical protein
MSDQTNLQTSYRRLVERAEAEAYETDRRGEDYEDWVHDITTGDSSLKKLAGFLDDAFIFDHAFCIKCNFQQMKEHAGFSDDEKKQAEKLVACCKLFFELGAVVLEHAQKFIGKGEVRS